MTTAAFTSCLQDVKAAVAVVSDTGVLCAHGEHRVEVDHGGGESHE